MTGTERAVEFVDVRKSFGTTKAVDGLSFDVTRGEMFGVIGPDGAGKTTSLRLICGLLAPDAGRVTMLGVEPFRDRRTATAAIGYLSQRFSLYGDLSIDENIAFFAEIHGVRDFASRRTRLLELTGLVKFRDRLADRLSGGMKQKLALACTLVHEPRMLVLDEPTTGVDPVSRREFWKLLAEFLSQGLTIVMATPYLDEAERCARVALVSEGRLLALDEPANLAAAMSGTILEIVATPARQALQVLRARLGRERVQLFGDRLHVRVDREAEGADLMAELARHEVAGAGVRAIVPTLEDVFIERLAIARAAGASPALPTAGSRR
ncbi:MAG TPA: ABC transporter ATP-binding protein [Vicinamibacterales bacterium]|nr:ABC transporter ATP-binding protein [Vicinamibacterales bacterium]